MTETKKADSTPADLTTEQTAVLQLVTITPQPRSAIWRSCRCAASSTPVCSTEPGNCVTTSASTTVFTWRSPSS